MSPICAAKRRRCCSCMCRSDGRLGCSTFLSALRARRIDGVCLAFQSAGSRTTTHPTRERRSNRGQFRYTHTPSKRALTSHWRTTAGVPCAPSLLNFGCSYYVQGFPPPPCLSSTFCILKPRARSRLPPSQREGSECCSCGRPTLAILRVSVSWQFIPTSAGIAVVSRDAGVGHDPARCTMQRVQHVRRCVSESVHSCLSPDAEPVLGGKDAPRSGLRLVSGKVISLVVWGRLASSLR